MNNYYLFFLLLILNIFLLKILIFLSFKFNLIDKPDFKRKLHKKKVPLAGGSLIILNLILYYILHLFYIKENSLPSEQFYGFEILLLFSFFIYLYGLLDDLFQLNYILKLILPVFTIYFLLVFDNNLIIEELNFNKLNINLSFYSIPFTILCFLLYLNACNMFDGINMQMASYSASILLVFFFKSEIFLLLFILVPLLIFLYYNYNNKIFLGDSGTNLLSFLISFFSIYLYYSKKITIEEIFLLMHLPGLDMFRIFLERIFKKKNPFKADRKHIHHMYLNYFSSNIVFLIIFFQSFIFYFVYCFFKSYLVIFLSIITYITCYLILIFNLKDKKV
jgi:UDP-GlcNAc:undecaprenyl-phosphate GlcNAc-1-phosphate transferase